MSIISKLLGADTMTGVVESVGKIIDNVTTTKEEKAAAILDQFKAVLSDVDSARKMEQNAQNSAVGSWFSKNIVAILAVFIVFLTFVLFYVFAFRNVPAESKDIVLYLLGVLSAALTQVLSFYFGSSQGSKDKAAELKQLKKPE